MVWFFIGVVIFLLVISIVAQNLDFDDASKKFRNIEDPIIYWIPFGIGPIILKTRWCIEDIIKKKKID